MKSTARTRTISASGRIYVILWTYIRSQTIWRPVERPAHLLPFIFASLTGDTRPFAGSMSTLSTSSTGTLQGMTSNFSSLSAPSAITLVHKASSSPRKMRTQEDSCDTSCGTFSTPRTRFPPAAGSQNAAKRGFHSHSCFFFCDTARRSSAFSDATPSWLDDFSFCIDGLRGKT